MTTRKTIANVVLACACPVSAGAHHSVAAWFDGDRTQEIIGVVTEIRWENPHVRFYMTAPDESGAEVTWDIETLSVSGISRWGVTPDLLSVGDRVIVSGSPSRRGLNNIFVRNVLLPGGQELVFGGEARYSARTLRGGETLEVSDGVPALPERGIFKVWSTGRGAGQVFPEAFDNDFDFETYPLTDAARAALAAFDYVAADPTNDCTPKGMPVIMEQPYPIEFVDRGDVILLRIEEYDQVRRIHVANVPEPGVPSPLGFSVGRMSGRDLLVTTTNISSGTFDSVGLPLSLEARLEERFAPSADGASLEYTLRIEDPVYFTAAVETGKRFIYRPEAKVEPFDCAL